MVLLAKAARMILWLVVAGTSLFFSHSAVITRWDFNSLQADSNPETGSLLDFTSSLVLAPIGSVNDSFGAVGGGNTSDTNRDDNSQLRLTHFPAANGPDRTAGLQIRVSTAGYRDIAIRWDQYNSATASRYWLLQFTTNGSEWIDGPSFIVTNASAWISRSFLLPGSVEDNPNFGLRLVAEHESGAIEGGTNAYVAAKPGSNYSTGGTMWVDMLTISGHRLDAPLPLPPVLSVISDVTMTAGKSATYTAFVSDPDTPLEQLTISASSSDTLLVTPAVSNSDTNLSVVLRAHGTRTGEATITIRVEDEAGLAAQRFFRVRVLPLNTAPSVSIITNQVTSRNAAIGPLSFTITDREQQPDQLTLSFISDNDLLFPPENLVIRGRGTNWTLQLIPASNLVGSATISIVTGDGELYGSTTFEVRVVATNQFAIWNFNSQDPDDNPATGSQDPIIGTAAFEPTAELNVTFGSVGGGATSDPVDADNSMLRFSSFPAQGSGNKTGGWEIHASTVGFGLVLLQWDQFNSGTASKYWRVQYATNGDDFVDYAVITNTRASVWHKAISVSFADIPGVENNPKFAVRVVAEFESTATGEGLDGYRAVESAGNYSRSGTMWLDSVELFADRIPGLNSAPQISGFSDQQWVRNQIVSPIPFHLEDHEQTPDSLLVTFESSNESIVPASAVQFSGSEEDRYFIVDPTMLQPGNTVVTVTVTDGDLSASTSFLITVVEEPVTPPMEVSVSVSFGPDGLAIAWPASGEEEHLEESIDFNFWEPLPDVAVSMDGTNFFKVPASKAAGFFRVRRDRVSGP